MASLLLFLNAFVQSHNSGSTQEKLKLTFIVAWIIQRTLD